MLRLIVAIALLLIGSSANAQQWRELYEPSVFNGMPVRVMKPIGFDPSKSYPVIVSLHGVSSSTEWREHVVVSDAWSASKKKSRR